MYKGIITGNTIIRKEIRQHKNIPMRQHFSTYLIPIKKNFLLIDTRFFTVSILPDDVAKAVEWILILYL